MSRYNWAAPAKLFFWPADDGSEEEAVYATLDDAIRAAGEGDNEHAWIITHDGDILNPRVIQALREELDERRRGKRSRAFSFLSRSRAA